MATFTIYHTITFKSSKNNSYLPQKIEKSSLNFTKIFTYNEFYTFLLTVSY